MRVTLSTVLSVILGVVLFAVTTLYYPDFVEQILFYASDFKDFVLAMLRDLGFERQVQVLARIALQDEQFAMMFFIIAARLAVTFGLVFLTWLFGGAFRVEREFLETEEIRNEREKLNNDRLTLVDERERLEAAMQTARRQGVNAPLARHAHDQMPPAAGPAHVNVTKSAVPSATGTHAPAGGSTGRSITGRAGEAAREQPLQPQQSAQNKAAIAAAGGGAEIAAAATSSTSLPAGSGNQRAASETGGSTAGDPLPSFLDGSGGAQGSSGLDGSSDDTLGQPKAGSPNERPAVPEAGPDALRANLSAARTDRSDRPVANPLAQPQAQETQPENRQDTADNTGPKTGSMTAAPGPSPLQNATAEVTIRKRPTDGRSDDRIAGNSDRAAPDDASALDDPLSKLG